LCSATIFQGYSHVEASYTHTSRLSFRRHIRSTDASRKRDHDIWQPFQHAGVADRASRLPKVLPVGVTDVALDLWLRPCPFGRDTIDPATTALDYGADRRGRMKLVQLGPNEGRALEVPATTNNDAKWFQDARSISSTST
jgi:hypothetical protein